MFRPDITVVVDRSLNINNDSCGADLEGRPEMSDVYPLSGISGLSFDSTLLSHLVFLPSPVTLSVFFSFLFPAFWPILLNLFLKILQYFSLRDRHFCMAPV